MVTVQQRLPSSQWVLSAPQFMGRFDDEVYRAQRYDMPLSLIVAHLPGRHTGADDRFPAFAATLRRIDLVTTPRAGLHLVCLPHTRRSEAEEVGRRLRDVFPEAVVGVVSFPTDGATSHQLLRSARNVASLV